MKHLKSFNDWKNISESSDHNDINEYWTFNDAKDFANKLLDTGSKAVSNLKNKSENTFSWGKELIKDFYYKKIKQGKSCNMSSKKTKKEAFLEAKKSGCNYFAWGGNWYNTETDMPIDQEIKAYAKKEYQYPVVVDYFEMGQKEAGGGFGHLQAWSLKEPKYQINAMPEKADIDKVLLGGVGDIKGGKGIAPEYSQTMYNQVCSELNGLKKQSITIKMNKKEYDNFKKIVGDWAKKKVKDVPDAVIGASKKSYNLLFSNCTDHTVRSTLFDMRAITGTLPLLGFKKIKSYYSGRYEERKTGVRVMNLDRLDISVPQQYEDPKYVIKNAETIVSNKWTIVLQETLWKQKESIKKLVGKNTDAQSAVTALDSMNTQSRKKDGSWDRTFKKGSTTDKALQAVRKLISSGYSPVKVDWKDFFKKK